MSVRKRQWETEQGDTRSAYVVQYSTAELAVALTVPPT
jgi:hypothetical protein